MRKRCWRRRRYDGHGYMGILCGLIELRLLSTAPGSTQGTLVSAIWDILPKALFNVIGTSHTTWATFIAAVHNWQCLQLQKHCSLTGLLLSPTAVIFQLLNHTHMSTPKPLSPTLQCPLPQFTSTAPVQPDAFTGGTAVWTWLLAYQSNQPLSILWSSTPGQHVAVPQSAICDAKVFLLNLLENLLPHPPHTKTGWTALLCTGQWVALQTWPLPTFLSRQAQTIPTHARDSTHQPYGWIHTIQLQYQEI